MPRSSTAPPPLLMGQGQGGSNRLCCDGALRVVDFEMAVAAQQLAFGRFVQHTQPRAVGDCAQVELKGFLARVSMMKRHGRVIALVPAPLAPATPEPDEEELSLESALLLLAIGLVATVCIGDLAPAGTVDPGAAPQLLSAGLAGWHKNPKR